MKNTRGKIEKECQGTDRKSNMTKNSSICAGCLETDPIQIPQLHVAPFENKTLGTSNPFHSAELIPNYNHVYPMTRTAQYRTQRYHCSGSPLLRKPPGFSHHCADNIPELPLRCYSGPCWSWAQFKAQFLLRIKGESAETLLLTWKITPQSGSW